MLEFETDYTSKFGEDSVVVHHEIGHALAWYRYGGAIGRLRFGRMSDGLLMGSVRFRGRDADTPELAYTESVAVRRLAGEIAARKLLQLPRDRIFCNEQITNSTRIEFVLPYIDRQSDVGFVLHAAYKFAGNGWFEWIAKRHQIACHIVDSGWDVIKSSARVLERFVPSEPDTEQLVPGLHLIELFEDGSIDADVSPAFEIVHNHVQGFICMRLRRYWRSHVTKSLMTELDPETT